MTSPASPKLLISSTEIPPQERAACLSPRCPSSEVDNDSYRRWEIAGASHVPEETGRYWEPLNGRDLIEIVFDCKDRLTATLVTLTSATTKQLTVNSPRIM